MGGYKFIFFLLGIFYWVREIVLDGIIVILERV